MTHTPTFSNDDFDHLETQIERRIEEARKKKDWAEIERLAKLGLMCRQGKDLASTISTELKATNGNSSSLFVPSVVGHRTGIPLKPQVCIGTSVSAKERGKQLRQKWLTDLLSKGIRLNQSRGKTIFLSRTGRKVGIGAATERLADKWFLGLPDEQFDVAVLLCEDQSGRLLDFVLPYAGLLDSVWSSLSRSNGQVKLNVLRSGVNFYLRVPSRNPLGIEQYLSNHTALR